MIPKKIRQNVVSAILVFGAILVLVQAFDPEQGQSDDPVPKASNYIEDWRALIEGRPLSSGTLEAPFVIIEFGDYGCPYCAKLQSELKLLVEDNPGDFSLYRIPFVVGEGEGSWQAAIASKCAEMQGIQQGYQKILYDNYSELDHLSFINLARNFDSADIDVFSSCMKDTETADLVMADQNLGDLLGVVATPTLVINGKVLVGGYGFEVLKAFAAEP